MTRAPLLLKSLVAPVGLSLLGGPASPQAVVLPGPADRFAAWLPLTRLCQYASDAKLASHIDLISGGLARAAMLTTTPDALLANLGEQATSLRFRRLHCVDEALRGLALNGVERLEEEIGINAYLSPPQTPFGLAAHRDPYDVLVVQLHGRKRWLLQGTDAGDAQELTSASGLLRGNFGELTLETGQVLFLPAYVRHRVTMVGEEPSLHLAIAVLRQTRRSILEWLVTSLSHSDFADARATGPSGVAVMLRSGEVSRELQQLTTEMTKLAQRDDLLASYKAHRQAVCYERTLAPPGEYEAGSARGYR